MRSLGRIDEAIDSLKHAAALDPRQAFPLIDLIACNLTLGRLDEAERLIQRLRGEGYPDLAAMQRVQLNAMTGQLGQAESTLRALQGSGSAETRFSAVDLLVRIDAEEGRTDDALADVLKAITNAHNSGDKNREASLILDQSWLFAHSGDIDACLKGLNQATVLNSSIRNILRAADVIGVLVDVGKPAWARQILTALDSLANRLPDSEPGMFFELARLRLRQEKLMASGDWKGALAVAHHATSIDFPAGPTPYLGRAFEALAKHTPKLDDQKTDFEEAKGVYARVALKSGFVWARPQTFPPGAWTDAIAAYLRCSSALGSEDDDRHNATRSWEDLHKNARVNFPQP